MTYVQIWYVHMYVYVLPVFYVRESTELNPFSLMTHK